MVGIRISDQLIQIRLRILIFSSLSFKTLPKNLFFLSFPAYYFLKVHLHHFSKIKSQKKSQNSRNQGFSYYFCMMREGSGSVHPTSGSWSRRSKKTYQVQIRRIRICNTTCYCIFNFGCGVGTMWRRCDGCCSWEWARTAPTRTGSPPSTSAASTTARRWWRFGAIMPLNFFIVIRR